MARSLQLRWRIFASHSLRLPAILASALVLWGALSIRPGPAGAQAPVSSLSAGWNNIVYLGPTMPASTFLAPVADKLISAMRWDAAGQRWRVYFPPSPQTSDLQTMETGKAYWIGVRAAVTLPQGSQSPVSEPLTPGWNNVAYLGSGGTNSAAIERTPVWAWDASRQGWLFHDASAPGASDFANLTSLQPYWLYNGPPSGTAAASPPASQENGCYPFQAVQPSLAEVNDALVHAALNQPPAYPGLEPAAERTGPDGNGGLQPPYIPPTLMRAIGWAESAWHQASWATKRGQTGPTLTSTSCAYGMMQILTGMSISGSPTPTQAWTGSDFRANAAAGAQILTRYWNRDPDRIPYLGRHDPHILEDWYFTVWAYHCFGDDCIGYGAHNNPDDPALTWPRPSYNSPEQLNSGTAFGYSDYPYQELVYGLVSNPPMGDQQPAWSPIPIQLPLHGSVGFPTPRAIPELSAHLDSGQSVAVVSASAPMPPPVIPALSSAAAPPPPPIVQLPPSAGAAPAVLVPPPAPPRER